MSLEATKVTTNWQKVKQFSNTWRIVDSEKYRKMSTIATIMTRTTNYCSYGKHILSPIASTEHNRSDGTKIYIYQFDFQQINYLVGSANHDVNYWVTNGVPAIRRPRLIGTDIDNVLSACIHANGNPMDYVSKEQIEPLRRYLGIKNKNYIPMMCYNHYIPIPFYGNNRLTLETIKKVDNIELEVEYTQILSDPLSPKRLAEIKAKQHQDHLKWVNKNKALAKPIPHDESLCYDCLNKPTTPTPFDIDDIKTDELIIIYFPQIRTRFHVQDMTFRLGLTPIITILTDETTNSTITIKFHDIEATFASRLPGVYEMLPYSMDHHEFSWRRLNKDYFIARGEFVCDKPIIAYITVNYIMHSGGMIAFRYST
jgi:hypothetical protein